MGKLTIAPLPLAGAALVETAVHGDLRGVFARLYCADELAGFLGGRSIVNVNLSRTAARGTVRGLHFQHPPHAEIKFVRCLRGEILDVLVDLRRGSPTFLAWTSVRLADPFAMVVVPAGFAHGFQTLTDDVEMLYLHTDFYAPGAEGGLSVTDPRLGIDWPLPIQGLSERDRGHPPIGDDFAGIAL